MNSKWDCLPDVGRESLERIVAGLLTSKNKTIAVAESCTGGIVSSKLTDVPGSSCYFREGIIAYSNEAKIRLLGVPPEMIKRFGAVSSQVAELMADGVRKSSSADIGIAITGIAGPEGGTTEKPVGLVYLGLADGNRVICEEYHFTGERSAIKLRASEAALKLVRRTLTC
ncbi:nicotinamide-nucleotide amidohydrolase family protein [candidate division NPL-UPA2 bacterium Unc8]|uniref:Nicotinamide-nucleotide amidohydrolase family protein n=1 Tax=candidate division NPL-UPA2 bacterium Unc8 TaxID=1980939 RepID=A0A399FU94_UNCN2|nr:CinA-like protein [Bacillota bacterium]MBT9147065.1 CinA-like protein [Bacillota bacterium]RIH99917.1 MAG: nicotinamide-nucleotide amidohydrolase family protein [candidate division NPL-UPA2 bacterium Unc8]